ncbi:hypothetical protein SBRCBS47491_009143 [Sporothrix bragantina]|uniref:GED domain-containing protein n=1 Tax=Sporothrix bragantina TaxID=671064 RepID=A0ABP0CTX4_9PEZI
MSDKFDKDSMPVDRIRRTDYINEVKNIINSSRGCELPGTFNPLVVTDLFQQQCKKWGALAEACVESIMQSSFALVSAALKHIAVEDTSDKIMRVLINPAMAALRKDMLYQLQDVLKTHTDGHPITYNHYLTENVQKIRNERLKTRVRAVVDGYVGHTFTRDDAVNVANFFVTDGEADMMRLAASDAIDYMEAYYKVALKTFVDTVGVLVVEQCFISKLPSLFTPDTIYTISDKDIANLAGENEQEISERSRLTEKLLCLQKCEVELRRLDKHRVPFMDDHIVDLNLEPQPDNMVDDAIDGTEDNLSVAGSDKATFDDQNIVQAVISEASPTASYFFGRPSLQEAPVAETPRVDDLFFSTTTKKKKRR